MSLATSLYQRSPAAVQDLLVGGYGAFLMAQRYRLSYFRWKRFYRSSATWSLRQLEAYQSERLGAFLRDASRHEFYRDRLRGLDLSGGGIPPETLERVPPMTKADLREHASEIGRGKKGVVLHTGGTTGAPLEVVITSADFQERQARLAVFRERHGARLGMRRATFSGRIIVTDADADARLWRHNWALNQRLYSSFHLTESYLDRYLEDLDRFRPQWLDGFPSSIYAVAKHAVDRGHTFSFQPLVGFSTSETLYDWQRETIFEAFGCPMRNQYASAEGAPFIVECPEGNLHMDLRTGVFEDTPDGLLVTSFTTTGTPLVRYAIGDRVELSDRSCPCGDHNPVVDGIYGRDQDSILSPERGPVFVGLVDIFKLVPPVIQTSQIAQTGPEDVVLRLVTKPGAVSPEHEDTLRRALRDRLGDMRVRIEYVDGIDRDASGKYRFIKREY